MTLKFNLEDGVKPCSKCKAVKPFSEFSICSKERLGVRSRCKACTSSDGKASYDPIKEKLRGARYRRLNPGKATIRTAEWRLKNRQRYLDNDKRWRDANPDKIKAQSSKHYAKARQCDKKRLSFAVRSMVRSKLKGKSKGTRRTFDLLGYSIDDLRSHLERLFLPGMDWSNYGKFGWHVDHKIPLAAFNYTSPDHIDFKIAWALDNLQPLWAVDNWAKHAKISEPFQPSLPL